MCYDDISIADGFEFGIQWGTLPDLTTAIETARTRAIHDRLDKLQAEGQT